MTYEIMVLLGGTFVLISLRRKKSKSKRRQRGFLILFSLVIESVVFIAGLSLFLFGVLRFIT